MLAFSVFILKCSFREIFNLASYSFLSRVNAWIRMGRVRINKARDTPLGLPRV